ncbi:hypothetical protein [Microvirga mediterraneensis]|uniref:Uncharacterized protein n=1 Tax=Microvirga mediterraneensis TaxID=2754695 RepID=A0A838BWT7_9HYPH|nr:hypothetical protein [Microvirga mediterraneensis]MBA1159373.1 hypothetical protein [Microvirga mediterraneensis]
MPPDFRVVAWCANTHDLLVETPDAFLMVDIAGYEDADGKAVLPELAEQQASFVRFKLQDEEWTVPLGSNLGATMIRPDHRAGTEKAVLQ